MEPRVNRAKRRKAPFSVLDTGILEPSGPTQLDIREALEANTTRFPIPGTLGFVEFEQHDYIVSTIKSRRP